MLERSEYEMCYDRNFAVEIPEDVWRQMKSYDKWISKNIKDNTFYIVACKDCKRDNWKKVKTIGNMSVYAVHYDNIEVSPFCKDCTINADCAIACFDNQVEFKPVEFKHLREKHLFNLPDDETSFIVQDWKNKSKFVYNGDSEYTGGSIVYTTKEDAIKSILEELVKNKKEMIAEINKIDNILKKM